MTLIADAERNRLSLIAQLYDEWHGWYVVQHLFMGQYVDVRPLTRDEATAYKCKAGEALSVRWNTKRKGE